MRWKSNCDCITVRIFFPISTISNLTWLIRHKAEYFKLLWISFDWNRRMQTLAQFFIKVILPRRKWILSYLYSRTICRVNRVLGTAEGNSINKPYSFISEMELIKSDFQQHHWIESFSRGLFRIHTLLIGLTIAQISSIQHMSHILIIQNKQNFRILGP